MPVGDVRGSAADQSQPARAPRSIKRPRATRAEMERRRGALRAIVAATRPITVRLVFRQAGVRGVVAAEQIAHLDVPAHIHLCELDLSGVDAGRKVEATRRRMAPRAEIHFERLAVLPKQIEAWSLPTRPTKASDSHVRGSGAVSMELDAIEPGRQRALVEEAGERSVLLGRVERLGGAAP